MGCLYRVTAKSGKAYIGISLKTADERWATHLSSIRQGRRKALQSAITKYGAETFSVETLVVANDWEYLCELERSAIRKFGTKAPNGYNLTDGGEGICGYEITGAARSAVSVAQKRRYEDPEQRAQIRANAAKGGAMGNAARWAGHVRQWPRPKVGEIERRARIRAAMATPQTQAKLSAAHRGRAKSAETRAKLSTAHLGRKNGPASASRKAMIRARQLASWSNPETRAKRIAGMAQKRKEREANGKT